MDTSSSDAVALLKQLKLPPGDRLPEGATESQIRDFESRTGLRIPARMRAWLKTSNGPCVGAGGVFGIQPQRNYLDIEYVMKLNPSWKNLGWIPIAEDGFGNHYCVVTRDEFGVGEPVIFIESLNGETVPTYIVASDTWHFLRFYFKRELEQTHWPFDRDEVLDDDPEIIRFHGVRLPWA